MNARARKLIGLLGILVFLAGYIALVTKLSDLIPSYWAAQLAFYVVAGVSWGIPILPLISWMNRGR
jgi:drug/metabolite transporter (DMT)-like permease